MSLHFFKSVKSTINHWYLPLISGLIFIAMAVWTFKEPEESYVALAFLFSLSFVISGLSDSIFSIANRKVVDGWGWGLAMGLITLIAGILMLMNPNISILTLPFYVGFIVLFRSMNAIGTALDLKSFGILDWGNLMIIGIIGVFTAFILLWNPIFAGLSIIVWTGIALLVMGIYSIIYALKLKKIHDIPKKVSEELLKQYNELEDQIIEELDS